jgi:hypothetical protein
VGSTCIDTISTPEIINKLLLIIKYNNTSTWGRGKEREGEERKGEGEGRGREGEEKGRGKEGGRKGREREREREER